MENKTKIVGFQSGHDVSYCVLENGIPIIHEELERVNRTKMELGDGLKFFLLRQTETNDVTHFTFGNWSGRAGKRHRITGDKKSEDEMKKILADTHGSFHEFSHHLCHASNAFYTSDFDTALIITIDAGGWEDDTLRTAMTINEGVGNKINRIKIFPISEIDLGGIWHKSTKDIFDLSVGFPKGDQSGTVMAMATLGEPKYTHLFENFAQNTEELKSIANISEQEKFNVAASLQKYTEETFCKYVSKYITESDHENICFSGGVSLNCVMMGKIKQWFPQIKRVFCDPVPYDAGLALGSARLLWHDVLNNPRINDIKNMSPYLGKIYSETDVQTALETFGEKIKITKVTDTDVLQKILNQKIISVFGGGSESGRRALGNRSIVADPRNESMKALINEKVKHRQWFRPFAPSILSEKVDEWFEENYESPYMSFAGKFKKKIQDKVPAVVHYDGTGRLQTVQKDLNPWYHNFLTEWEKLSGIPILLNTSFNDSEPIVETPEDALRCFLGTDIDCLYFFEYGILIEKSSI